MAASGAALSGPIGTVRTSLSDELPARSVNQRGAPLRLLHVTNMLPGPGRPAMGSFVATQIRSLERLGVRQDVLHLAEAASSLKYIRAIGVIRKRVARGDVNLIHAHYGLTGWAGSWISIPLVVSFAGSDLYGMRRGTPGQRLRGRAEVLASQWAALRADRIIVMSARMRELLWGRHARAKAVVLPYGIETARFCPGSKLAARRHFGLDLSEQIVLWPHSPSPIKRRDLAEASIALARQTLPQLRLWTPPMLPNEEMVTCYQASDCLLVTSDTEGSPNVVKEALSATLPVVSVDVGDVWQWIERVPWCTRVSRDPRDIADALIRTAQSPRPDAPPSLIQEFDASRVASRLLQLYEEVIGHATALRAQ